MHIAIVGSGISGLAAAYALRSEHRVTVFEQDGEAGGHVKTVAVDAPSGPVQVDTGFIVYNERTYPGFVGLLAELGVQTQASDMSFGCRCDACGLAYSSRGTRGFFRGPADDRPTGPVANARGHPPLLRRRPVGARRPGARPASRWASGSTSIAMARPFRDHFIVPITSAVWSTSADRVEAFPVDYLLRFLDNHGLIGVGNAPRWRVVRGGSADLRRRARGRAAGRDPAYGRRGHRGRARPVRRHHRHAATAASGSTPWSWRRTPTMRSDSSATPDSRETRALGGFEYSTNAVVLHTDERVLPAQPACPRLLERLRTVTAAARAMPSS